MSHDDTQNLAARVAELERELAVLNEEHDEVCRDRVLRFKERDLARADAEKMRAVFEAAKAWERAQVEVEKYVGIDTAPAIKARQDEWRATDALRAALSTITEPTP